MQYNGRVKRPSGSGRGRKGGAEGEAMRKFFLFLTLTGSLLAQPGPLTIDFGGPRPGAGVQVSTSNTWTQDNALTLHDPSSSATVVFPIPAGTDPSGWVMGVTDRMSSTGMGQGTIYPSFTINGRNVPTQAVTGDQFATTRYPVGQYLRPGRNVLQITASVVESVNEYQVERITFGPP